MASCAGVYSTYIRAMKLLRLALLVLAASAVTVVGAQSPSPVDTAFQKFWDARSPSEAAKLVDGVLKTGVTYDDALKQLKRGRTYSSQKTGVVMSTNKTGDNVEHYYAVNVPAGYDPAKTYQVRFQLHGGVMGRSTNQPRNSGEHRKSRRRRRAVLRAAVRVDGRALVERRQVLNLHDDRRLAEAHLQHRRESRRRRPACRTAPRARTTSRCGNRRRSPASCRSTASSWCSPIPIPGCATQLYPNNLRNKPLYAINGGRDRLYPISTVEPYLLHLKKAGVSIDYHPQPLGEHNTAWWPDVKASFERFVTDHPRDPSPARLTWETSDLAHGRAHWLVITKLGKSGSDAKHLPDANDYSPVDVLAAPLFEHRQRSGRVDLVRTGNTVDASTRGVTEFTLLVSPDAFDLSQPIKVVANGSTVFEARVKPSVATLMKWAARDNDRTMLYAAEIEIRLAR